MGEGERVKRVRRGISHRGLQSGSAAVPIFRHVPRLADHRQSRCREGTTSRDSTHRYPLPACPVCSLRPIRSSPARRRTSPASSSRSSVVAQGHPRRCLPGLGSGRRSALGRKGTRALNEVSGSAMRIECLMWIRTLCPNYPLSAQSLLSHSEGLGAYQACQADTDRRHPSHLPL